MLLGILITSFRAIARFTSIMENWNAIMHLLGAILWKLIVLFCSFFSSFPVVSRQSKAFGRGSSSLEISVHWPAAGAGAAFLKVGACEWLPRPLLQISQTCKGRHNFEKKYSFTPTSLPKRKQDTESLWATWNLYKTNPNIWRIVCFFLS